ncbi:hypothetical protein ACT3T8_15870 [Halomonas sp. AOP1-B1-8]|uniref:hypothetical protein n=1 Tax=Halomonas sp. AOP1-B1-8 TaxID=3457726 RepID=UPI003FDA4CEB
MKKNLTVVMGAAVLSVLSGCATVEQTGRLESRVGQLENQVRILETRAASQTNSSNQTDSGQGYYCYMNGVRYTEGAVINQQRCTKTGIIVGGDPKLQWRNSN